MKITRVLAVLLTTLVVMFAASCENALYTLLSRTTNDPFDEAPSVRSFDRELNVRLSWKDDEGADRYILRRSEDKNIPDFSTIVYYGKATSFTDSGLLADSRYLYRLDKVRGSQTFFGKTTSLSVCSKLKQDFFEDNNTLETATPFPVKVKANLYYYQFIDGRVLEDVDWYSIRIPAHATAVFVINETDIDPAVKETVFICTIDRFYSYNLNEGGSISIENATNETDTFYFMIGANALQFRKLYGNGTIRSYTLQLKNITFN